MRKMRCICRSGKQTGCGRNDRAGLPRSSSRWTRNVHLFSPFPEGKLQDSRADTRVHACPRSRARVGITQRVSASLLAITWPYEICSRLSSHSRLNFSSSRNRGIRDYILRVMIILPSVMRRVKYSCDIYSNNCERTLPPCPLR